MNTVEIEEAVSQLASAPFDANAFPFAFLEAFGNKETTIKKRRPGEGNRRGKAAYLAILLPCYPNDTLIRIFRSERPRHLT